MRKRRIDYDYMHNMHLWIPSGIYLRLKRIGRATGRTITKLIIEALNKYLEEEDHG